MNKHKKATATILDTQPQNNTENFVICTQSPEDTYEFTTQMQQKYTKRLCEQLRTNLGI